MRVRLASCRLSSLQKPFNKLPKFSLDLHTYNTQSQSIKIDGFITISCGLKIINFLAFSF